MKQLAMDLHNKMNLIYLHTGYSFKLFLCLLVLLTIISPVKGDDNDLLIQTKNNIEKIEEVISEINEEIKSCNIDFDYVEYWFNRLEIEINGLNRTLNRSSNIDKAYGNRIENINQDFTNLKNTVEQKEIKKKEKERKEKEKNRILSKLDSINNKVNELIKISDFCLLEECQLCLDSVKLENEKLSEELTIIMNVQNIFENESKLKELRDSIRQNIIIIRNLTIPEKKRIWDVVLKWGIGIMALFITGNMIYNLIKAKKMKKGSGDNDIPSI
jgi:hypothetical protein